MCFVEVLSPREKKKKTHFVCNVPRRPLALHATSKVLRRDPRLLARLPVAGEFVAASRGVAPHFVAVAVDADGRGGGYLGGITTQNLRGIACEIEMK